MMTIKDEIGRITREKDVKAVGVLFHYLHECCGFKYETIYDLFGRWNESGEDITQQVFYGWIGEMELGVEYLDQQAEDS